LRLTVRWGLAIFESARSVREGARNLTNETLNFYSPNGLSGILKVREKNKRFWDKKFDHFDLKLYT